MTTDLLNEMFEQQKEFAKQFTDFDNMTDDERDIATKEYVMCIIEECIELLRCIKHKHWRKNEKSKGIKSIKEELADITAFFINLALTHNVDAEELAHNHLDKVKTNWERIRSGY